MPQVLLPNSRPLSVEAVSVTVKQQKLPVPPASTVSEVVNKDGAKANVKEATVSDLNKSAKSGKKQKGISLYQVDITLLFLLLIVHLLISYFISFPSFH